MKILWYGHACFRITSADGTVIVTDPYDASVPYKAPEGPAHIVTVSHDHFDHNAVDRVKGSPEVLRGVGEWTIRGVQIRGIAAYHDPKGGKERGRNVIFKLVVDRVVLAHFGDLGHPLTAEQLKPLEDVQVALLPVGGFYTVGPKEAKEVVQALPNVRVVIPMHYRTEAVKDWPIRPVQEFLEAVDLTVREFKGEAEVTAANLPKAKEVWILSYA
ncbi:MAG: MBL fold metallo-hydrolase [Candidatus Bipolaricaulota bacterium]|nr:MBL fold metallo-hydrolase [Candidatus Bipolaricaulota bacterium]MCX7843969.1 MBL fold metallo-hydrolase [Candidatus Bipolaricaulota bacterium]MDW8151724.1 MBL fold metallo-hydrolase [Candidatus Bipolaricaulota bacterium]